MWHGIKVSGVIEDVGKYFPFVNREKSLLKHLGRLNRFLLWCKYCGIPDLYKSSEAEYNVCCGASGIGKTTFVTDELYKFASMINTLEPEFQKIYGHTVSLLENCTKRGLVFRLNFKDVQPLSEELQNPNIIPILKYIEKDRNEI